MDVHAERATAGNLADWLARYDLVVDCSDNFATKFAGQRRRREPRQARRLRQRVPVRRPVAGVPAARGLAVPALPVARGAARRPRRQLRAGRRARPGARHARCDAGDAGAEDPARPAGGALAGRCTSSTCSACTGARSRRRAIRPAITRRASCRRTPIDPAALELEYPTLAPRSASGLTLVDIREPWERAMDDPRRTDRMAPAA